MLLYKLIPSQSHSIQVDIERLLFSLAVKLHNFWGPKIDKKVINSSTKCLISVKIVILTPHIIPPPTGGECLVDIQIAETCKLTCLHFEDFYRLDKWEFIACSNRQFYVCSVVLYMPYFRGNWLIETHYLSEGHWAANYIVQEPSCVHIISKEWTHWGPSFINQLISYLPFMTANENHTYLNRLFDSVHDRYNWINHDRVIKKRLKQKQTIVTHWSILLPKIAVLWKYTCSPL